MRLGCPSDMKSTDLKHLRFIVRLLRDAFFTSESASSLVRRGMCKNLHPQRSPSILACASAWGVVHHSQPAYAVTLSTISMSASRQASAKPPAQRDV